MLTIHVTYQEIKNMKINYFEIVKKKLLELFLLVHFWQRKENQDVRK